MEREEQLMESQELQVEPNAEVQPQQICGPNTTPYVVRQGDTFFTIARQFGVTVDALIQANPQITDPSNIRPGQIVCIPNQPTTCPSWTFPYVVQRGDSMFTIAERFGVSLQQLMQANPQIPDPSRIQPGQIVCVPFVSCPTNTFSYIVERGDTMFSIAQRFDVPLQALLNANPQVTNPNQLYPGQNVCVPRSMPPPQTCPAGTFPYTVQKGDSMWSIAQKFGVSLDALIRANPQIPNPSLIYPGQIVCVPSGPPPSTCPAGTFPYTVQKGDSMWSIAQKFGVSLDALIRANPQIPNPSVIHPGQIVCVPSGHPSGMCPPGTFGYTVQPGDSMWSIARKFGVSLDALIRANPQIADPSKIRPGQVICVPNR